jgi:YegS/Rv2252/BmrU family lipid kinase
MMRPFFVVNPHSANGATRGRFLAAQPILRQAFPDLAFAFTDGPRHATALAAQAAADGADLIVACGGDGTLNETVCGLLESGRGGDVALAMMPSGTGGDFRRVAGFPAEPEAFVRFLREGSARPVDAGLLDSLGPDGRPRRRHFLNICSLGISGVVDHYVNHTTKAFGGRVSFFVGTLRGMLAYRNVPMRVTVDGTVFYEGPTNLVAAANGRFFGGGMMVAPLADLSDGLFDVVVFGDLSKLDFLALTGRIYSGAHLGRPGILHTRGKVVEIQPQDEALIDLDGEDGGRAPARIEILPGAGPVWGV